jgi:uncharacterized repeat protein (TIGR03803 family)
MQSNQFWAAAGKMLAVVAVALLVVLMLVPGASAARKYKVLYRFSGGVDGGQPNAGLIFDGAGNFYSTTYQGGTYGNGVVFELTPNSDGSWTESVLYSFTGGSDGGTPYSALTFDTKGNLYGTTGAGGAYGYGTVFQLTPTGGSWTETVIYSFTGGSDGANPWYGVTFDAAGILYSATSAGGVQGQGVVYKLTPNTDGSWTYGLLHSFTGGQDGSYPLYGGSLTFDTAGNLYGATSDGVDPWGYCPSGNDCGSIFEMTRQSDGSWKELVIFRFDGSHGLKPLSPVIFDSAGRLYGTASGGGGFYGTAFKLTRGAKGKWTETVLHEFGGDQDGAYPAGGVVFNKAGALFGTTALGEDLNGHCCVGQVFGLRHAKGEWNKWALHRFQDAPKDGANSSAPVVFDAAGNLFGTVENGGSSGNGVVFEMTAP